MYVDSYMLLTIYVIAVLALAVGVYAVWSINELEKRLNSFYNKMVNTNKEKKWT